MNAAFDKYLRLKKEMMESSESEDYKRGYADAIYWAMYYYHDGDGLIKYEALNEPVK